MNAGVAAWPLQFAWIRFWAERSEPTASAVSGYFRVKNHIVGKLKIFAIRLYCSFFDWDVNACIHYKTRGLCLIFRFYNFFPIPIDLQKKWHAPAASSLLPHVSGYINPRPYSVFRHLRQCRGLVRPPLPSVSKLSVAQLSEKNQRIALYKYSRLVMRFLIIDQKLTPFWGFKC